MKNYLPYIYLSFSIAGAIFPTLANIEFMRTYGPIFDLRSFIDLANDNPAAQSLSRDLLIGASAIFVWIISESRRLSMKNIGLVVLGTFAISFAFGAPLFLFLREKRLLEIEQSGEQLNL